VNGMILDAQSNRAALACQVFEAAVQAFNSGDYESAVAHAKQAELLVSRTMVVEDHNSSHHPLYSIIVVLFVDHPGVRDTVQALSAYVESDAFELILVNNGHFSSEIFLRDGLNNFMWVDVGFNYGCSGGRNLGARVARGEYLIFLDDDGITGDRAIESLIGAVTENYALAVRGRVRAKAEGGIIGPHYDLGESIVCSIPNTEGISIWRRNEFLDFGGFDTLLYGREGVELWSKMYRFYGPDEFLYTPHALLSHDFAKDIDHLRNKKARLREGQNYLNRLFPNHVAARATIKRARTELRSQVLFQRARRSIKKAMSGVHPSCQVSVLTHGAPLNRAHIRSLLMQTHRDFEVILAFGSAEDAELEIVRTLCNGDARFRLLRADGNKAELLNVAISHANSDVCVIAQGTDVSNPRRLELTGRLFAAHPEAACISFATFSETQLHSVPFSLTSPTIGLKIRSLLGLPVSFPALAFRKSMFVKPADSSIPVGYKCKWIYDNINQATSEGIVIPSNQVFSEAPAYSSSDSEVEVQCIYAAHAKVLGTLGEQEKYCCRVLADKETARNLIEIENYVLNLLVRNEESRCYDQLPLEEFLLQHLMQLQLKEPTLERKKRSSEPKPKSRFFTIWNNG